MLSPEDLAAIRGRAEAGIGGYGEWKVEKYDDDRRVDRFISTPKGSWIAQSVLPETATFIAHARTDVPALVAEVERLHKVGSYLLGMSHGWQERAERAESAIASVRSNLSKYVDDCAFTPKAHDNG